MTAPRPYTLTPRALAQQRATERKITAFLVAVAYVAAWAIVAGYATSIVMAGWR